MSKINNLSLHLTRLEILELQRRKYPFRYPVGSSSLLLAHPHKRSFILFLELKKLFVSGVLWNDNNIRLHLGICSNSLKKHLSVCKKYKLIHYDTEKNIHFSRMAFLSSILGTHSKRKESIKDTIGMEKEIIETKYTQQKTKKQFVYVKEKNLQTAENLIQAKALEKNFRKQEYAVKKKLFTIYLQEKYLNTNSASGCGLNNSLVNKEKKLFALQYENLKEGRCGVYEKQIRQIDLGFPSCNPNITLSCKGTANVLGLNSIGAGWYWQQKLVKSGLLKVRGQYCPIAKNSPAIYEKQMLGIRSDVFSYEYPVKHSKGKEFERKYFLRLPNILTLPLVEKEAERTKVVANLLKERNAERKMAVS